MTIMSKDLLEVSISPDGYAEVRNGAFTKKVSLKDFSSVINGLIDQEDQVISNSTIRYPSSVHSVTRTNNGYIVNLYFAEREAKVKHVNTGLLDIYMPNVMIRVELNNIVGKAGEFSLGNIRWYGTDKTASALSTDWPSGPSSLNHIWTLPLPNMFHDARMCTGGNRLPSVVYMDWTILDMLYYDVLLGSPFNNDLIVHAASSSSGEVWLRKLNTQWNDEDSDRFPYELLTNY